MQIFSRMLLFALLFATPAEAEELPVLRISTQMKDYIETFAQSGVLKDAPYRVEWSLLVTATDETASLLANTTDLAIAEGTVSVTLQQGGSQKSWADGQAPVTIITAYVPRDSEHYNSMVTLVAANSPIHTPADLKGHSLTFKKGGNMNTQTLLAVKKGGLSPKDVSFVELSPAEGLVAFRSGQVDALTNSPAVVQNLVDSGRARVLLTNTDVDFPAGLATVVRTADLKDPAREAIFRDFIRRVRRWNDWKVTHTAEVERVLVETNHLKPEVAAYQARADINDPVVVDAAFLATEQRIADAVFEAGGIAHRVDVSLQYDTRLNADIAAGLAGN
jgi:sulfonate transport system substrate-binding protein